MTDLYDTLQVTTALATKCSKRHQKLFTMQTENTVEGKCLNIIK